MLLSVWLCCCQCGHVVVSMLLSPPPCDCRQHCCPCCCCHQCGVGVVKVTVGDKAAAHCCHHLLQPVQNKTKNIQQLENAHSSHRERVSEKHTYSFDVFFMSYATLFPSSFPTNDKPNHCTAPDMSHPDGTIPSAKFTACPHPHAHQLTQQQWGQVHSAPKNSSIMCHAHYVVVAAAAVVGVFGAVGVVGANCGGWSMSHLCSMIMRTLCWWCHGDTVLAHIAALQRWNMSSLVERVNSTRWEFFHWVHCPIVLHVPPLLPPPACPKDKPFTSALTEFPTVSDDLAQRQVVRTNENKAKTRTMPVEDAHPICNWGTHQGDKGCWAGLAVLCNCCVANKVANVCQAVSMDSMQPLLDLEEVVRACGPPLFLGAVGVMGWERCTVSKGRICCQDLECKKKSQVTFKFISWLVWAWSQHGM